MDELTCRLLPYAARDGPTNMAADEVLLHRADRIASLRFYGWSEPTLSLGYFQPASERLADPRLASLPWVRRPSGGAALVHHHELTYALALPRGLPWQPAGSWMAGMHGIIRSVLVGLGAGGGKIVQAAAKKEKRAATLCFQQIAPGDLLCTGAKVVGSAQRRQRQALLQHGAILLRQSEFTPQLPGIYELTGMELTAQELSARLVRKLAGETGWVFEARGWERQEAEAVEELAERKYRSPKWNERR